MEKKQTERKKNRRKSKKQKRERTTDIDVVIGAVVKEIWAEYDDDNSGSLDKDETKLFVKNTLCDIADGKGLSDEEFEQCFAEFDTDGSGTIEQIEMI